MAVPGCPSPAFWMASMASVRTGSTASRPNSTLVWGAVTAAPRDGIGADVLLAARQLPTLRLPRLPASIPSADGLLRLHRAAGHGALTEGELLQHLVGRDHLGALGGVLALPLAVLAQLPGLHVVLEHDFEDLLDAAGGGGGGHR